MLNAIVVVLLLQFKVPGLHLGLRGSRHQRRRQAACPLPHRGSVHSRQVIPTNSLNQPTELSYPIIFFLTLMIVDLNSIRVSA